MVGGEMSTRITKDQWAMELAQTTAKRSTCLRRHVGCVLLNERGHVLATGYNGVAAGLPHCNATQLEIKAFVERYGMNEAWAEHEVTDYPHACGGHDSPSGTNLDACQAIHAEQNALLQCRNAWEIHTAYVTVSPCMTCVKMLLNTSCQRIVFAEQYPHVEAKTLWVQAGRMWEPI